MLTRPHRRIQGTPLKVPEAQGLRLRRPRLARRPRRQQLRAQVPREAGREGMGEEDVKQPFVVVCFSMLQDMESS